MNALASLLVAAAVLIALALVALLRREEPEQDSLAMARLRQIKRDNPTFIDDLHRRLDAIEAEER